MSVFSSPEAKKFINSLFCPMCKCGLEGIPYLLTDGKTEKIHLYCAQNINHYCKIFTWNVDEKFEPFLVSEELTFIISNKRYIIWKKNGHSYTVYISIVNGDYEAMSTICALDIKLD